MSGQAGPRAAEEAGRPATAPMPSRSAARGWPGPGGGGGASARSGTAGSHATEGMEAEEEVDAAEAELGRRAEASIANYVHGLPEAAAELLRAIQSGDVGAVQRLASTPEGRATLAGGKPPPLVLAASNGDDAMVAALVELGAPLAGCSASSGLTALHAAAGAGDERTVRLYAINLYNSHHI